MKDRYPAHSLASSEVNKTPLKNWGRVTLGDVCQIVGGTTPSTAVAEYWGGNVVWITPADLGKLEGKEIYSSERKITEKSLGATNLEPLPVGTVVLSSRAPIGHLGIAETPLCTNQGCKSFIPSGDIDSEYLYFVLKIHVADFQRLGSGSTFKEISKSTLTSFEIPLPPLAEQKRIVAALNEQMAAVEKARTAALEKVEAVRALASTWLREVFSFGEGGLPHGWRWEKLGNISEIISGQSPPSETYRKNPEGLPFFQGKADFGTKNPIARIYCVSPKKIALPGDILISVRAPVGPTNVADIECSIGRGLAIVRCGKQTNKEFILSFLKFYEKEISLMGSGSTFQSINREHLLNLKVPLPPLTEQKRLISALKGKIAAAEKARVAAEAELEDITALPSALLRQAFSGAL